MVTLESTTSNELTTNISGITTNVETNVVSSPASLVLGSNSFAIGSGLVTNAGATNSPNVATSTGTTNLTVGYTNGDYYLTLTATNGTTNVNVTSVGVNGPVTTDESASTVTLYANQTSAVGTNAATATETNVTFGGTGEPVDAASITIETNGVTVTNILIGTNSFAISTNSPGAGTNVVTVTVGTTSVSVTNTATVTNLVLLGTNVVDTNGVTSGFGTNATFTSSLTTTFTFVTNTVVTTNSGGIPTNTVITTNVAVVTETAENLLTTNVVTNRTTNYESVVVTNSGGPAQFAVVQVISNVPVYTAVPAGLLTIAPANTNDVAADTRTTTSDYAVETLTVNDPANVTGVSYLKVQGVVHNTAQDLAVKTAAGGEIVVTNSAWTDVSGWGTNDGAPIVVGGTITVGTPSAQKVPQ